jgi:hypothetical protein
MSQLDTFNGQVSQLLTSVVEVQEKLALHGQGPVPDVELQILGRLTDLTSSELDRLNAAIPNS